MSKKHKAHRASVQRAIADGTRPVPAESNSPPPPHKLRGLARQEWIDQQAHEMYQRRIGDSIDLAVQACKQTAEAFNSQMGELKGGGQGWGPDVSPYENRMTGSLMARLLREKRAWLRDFREQIEQALKDEAAAEEEAAAAEPAESTSAQHASAGPPTPAFTPDAGDYPEPPPGAEPAAMTAANESS